MNTIIITEISSMEKTEFRHFADNEILNKKHNRKSFLEKYLITFIILWFVTVTTLLYKNANLPKYSFVNKLHNETDTVNSTNTKLLLVVGVLTKLSVVARRNTIRATWFQQCKANPGIAQCRFFTDQLTNSTEMVYQRENNENGQDMLFMPIKGGYSFAQRLVWMMQWFTENYEFDFLLRVDDDYFLCMNRLLLELPHRPKTGLYWGWVHCFNNIVRVDEGWMILTKDIIEEALSKYNTTLLCHPFGDQAVPLWIRDSKLPITWFADNGRVIHQATTYTASKFMAKDLCEKYLGLHGTYKDKMFNYWTVSESKVIRFRENNNNGNRDSKQPNYYIPTIPNFHHVCKADMNFKNTAFNDGMRFEPKLCKDNPKWSISDATHKGRENSR